MAFAESEAHGLYSALALLRGFAIQLSYRWGLGTVLATQDNKAVLLWSPVRHSHRDMGHLRGTVAMFAGVVTGVSLFLLSNALLLTPLSLLLHVLGISAGTVRDVGIVVV